MQKVEFFRLRYPEFIYKSYSWELKKGNLEISFRFCVSPNIHFEPKLVIENVSKENLERVGESALRNFVFHLGLMEIPSYWKATCSPKICIGAGALGKAQIRWWHDLFLNGMGEFFYTNRVDFSKADFLTIEAFPSMGNGSRFNGDVRERILVPVGGGKDATVTLEVLKTSKVSVKGFILNPKKEQLLILKIAKQGGPIVVRRTIDPKLLELNRRGYLNGHTPFSAYLAFLTVFCAALFDYKYIALSNERSSNEGNIPYLDRTVNHQYSKSFDFEKKFRAYTKKYLSKNIEYFSFLRPLYELQIAKIFARYPKYLPVFLSCNEAHKTASGSKKPARRWCGKCPKCLFVFASLNLFIRGEKLVKIFGKNLFEDKTLIPLMEELVGERKFKPFECVGTIQESLAAFYLCLQKTHSPLPILFEYFRQHVVKKHPDLRQSSRKIINSWNTQNFVPRSLDTILRNAMLDLRRRG